MGRVGLVRTLKGVVIFIALIVTVFYCLIFPQMIREMGQVDASLTWLVEPSIAAVSVSVIPIAVALALFWMICTEVGRDNSFCHKNARLLCGIGVCALVDTGYCAVGTVTLCFLVQLHISILLMGITASVAGTAIALAAFLLSHLVLKAADLKSENDLTI